LVNFPEPLLLSPGETFTDFVAKGKAKYYFYPFTRLKVSSNLVLALDKMGSGDSFMAGRVISNAYLPYLNWTYPNASRFDFISQSQASSNEVLEINATQLLRNCPGNTSSCALIIAIISNAPLGSKYSLTQMDLSNRIFPN
jgi:hypothetical protein